MTIQRRIYEAQGSPSNRDFSKLIRRHEGYTSNCLKAKKSISIELAIDMMERLYFTREQISEIVLLYLKEEFNIFA